MIQTTALVDIGGWYCSQAYGWDIQNLEPKKKDTIFSKRKKHIHDLEFHGLIFGGVFMGIGD